MSVYSSLLTVHFEWGTNLETKTFSTLKLKELQSNKTRLKQPLLGAVSTQNFTQICWTTVEKWSQDISTH